nr:hypothetical protein [Tanacetum cinerariifolium]
MQNNLALIAKYFKKIFKPTNNNLRTSSNSRNKNVDTTPRYKNDNQSGQFGNQRTANVAGARENVGKDTNEEIDEQELEAHYSYMAKIQETEFEKYKAFNDRTIDYDKLERKLNETLGQLALKDIKIKEEKHSISLEIALQKCKEQVKNDTVWNEKASNVFRKEHEQYIEIQDLKAQLQDKNIAISELKKLIEKGKGKFIENKFDKPSVVRQPNAQRIPKPSVLGKPAPFSNSLERRYFSKTKSVPKTNVSEGLSKPVTALTLPQITRQAVSNTNMLKLGMYRINNKTTQTRAIESPQIVRNTNPHVSTSTGVNHNTNVSRPQHRSNQLKDKAMPNNSQVKLKKSQVEEHPRIPSIANKTKSVTACKYSLNSKTLNANAVCATCNKCLVDSNHFACVTKMLNDVNARTKKPNILQLIIFIVDSGCTKHMTGNLKLLCNFVEKFLEIPSTKTQRTSSKVDKSQFNLETNRKNLEAKRKF